LEGIFNDTSGAPKPDTAITLMATTDNSTFPNSLQTVASTTTDVNGFYTFTISPTEAGTYYYYLQDDSTGTYTYLESYTVSGGGMDLTLVLAIVAIVAIIIAIVVVLIVVRRRRK
jgi:subtilase family serine protease